MAHELMFIVILVGGAAVVPLFARMLRLPSSIMEIAYGVLIFSVFLHDKPEWFVFFKEIGLIYLMFIAGMELDLRRMMRQGSVLMYLVLVLISFITVPLIFMRMGYPFYLGIVVSLISGGIIIPILKESGLMKSPMGRETISFTLSGEFLSILVLTGLDIYHRYGASMDMIFSVGRIVAVFTFALVFLKVLHLLAWWMPEKVDRVMQSEDPVEEGIRAVIFVAFAGALLAYWAGVEPILGSFMAGTIFSYVFKSKGRFEEKVNALGFGFFIPLFFIGVGGEFDVTLLSSPKAVGFALFLSVMVFASNLPVMLFPLITKRTPAEAMGMTLLLSAPLSMMIVAGTIGIKAGLLDESYFNAIILASMISSVLYPSLFRPFARYIPRGETRKA